MTRQTTRSYSVAFMTKILVVMFAAIVFVGVDAASARQVPLDKGGKKTPQRFIRQRNTLSNIDFFFTNRGQLFNNDNIAGLQWPRGTNNSYIFGGGLWFATKKVVGGKRRKLCELGYNPNSGAGWYTEGEINGAVDGASVDAKYASYLSSRYDDLTGKYTGAQGLSYQPGPQQPWPIWDTSQTKTLNENYYFGDYISDVTLRKETTVGTKNTRPAMLSQEDIVNIYTDQDVANNPEYRPNTGYPFNLNFVEVIYSWSFGRYRDMMFLRHKVTNASKDTLYECFMAPAFDPDLGPGSGSNPAGNDMNQYVDSADVTVTRRVLKGTCFENNPRRLNMAYQHSRPEGGKEYGVVGFAFLESPATTNEGIVLDNSDYDAVGGYGLPDSRPQLGLTTFKKWTIQNDPPTENLRYDFVSDGSKDGDGGIVGDVRLLFSTGPFTLPPQKSVETVVAIGMALASTTEKQKNIDSVFKLIAFAHSVFGGDCYTEYSTVITPEGDTVTRSTISHFVTPVPPDIPKMKTTALDRAVLVEWDSTAEKSIDPLSSSTLAFNTYDLYRTTRSDLDSTIRPAGVNPVVKLGSWSLYDFRLDSSFVGGEFVGFKRTRINAQPHPIPHAYLDLGDDNHDGALTGDEGLYNGVKYYYFMTATDEYDSLNSVGPLTTAIVAPQNLVTGIPAKPVYPNLPDSMTSGIACYSGENLQASPQVAGIKQVSATIVDTGKFVELFTNDTIKVSIQPRWSEFTSRYLNLSPLMLYIDVQDTRQGIDLTYDALYDPTGASGTIPYSIASGLTQQVIGQKADSNVQGKFTTNLSNFVPNQLIQQSFSAEADFEFTQLKDRYHISSVDFSGLTGGDRNIFRFSQRTVPAKDRGPIDYANIPMDFTNPSFLGSLGEVTYEIEFGQPVDMANPEYDTLTNKTYLLTSLYDENIGAEYRPRPLPVTIRSLTHCGEALHTVRPHTRNDFTPEFDARFYTTINSQSEPGNPIPGFSDPDTMLVPNPGWFAIDAFHYSDLDATNHSGANFFKKTVGNYYYSQFDAPVQSGDNYLATVHRIRLAGAEIILNRPGINDPSTSGDTIQNDGQYQSDFRPGDKIRISFGGQARGLPFPGVPFTIVTSPDGTVNFASSELYKQQEILDQVQVVPNPYIVTHQGQSSTDNAKLFFTRLPPRATIEIYTLDGSLVKTIEHVGYALVSDEAGNTHYDYNTLGYRYNVAEWNLLSEGRQRVGSQVLIARVIAKDPNNGDAVLGETSTKFAVVLGGYRAIR